ncbi:Glutamine amidotransferase class-I [Pseudomonas sp. ok272]|uniref:CTP synthase C-terminal region-related (seleno)protein n=1 Tax=unclassified Pseudomonas TaxID=196821 RepID=UPI0008D5EC73|nr:MULTISPECIES: CTP synthase [unclassified Pseudomonas]SEN38462.1 Glutamine amidotransferase class-I [Pseudomonas sp. ok272]SFN22600.1 Glutamine amidotransferase class-I [Pseudomonas sp. ok602]
MASTQRLRIALIGDYDPQVTAHQAIPLALDMAAQHTGHPVAFQWLATERIDASTPLTDYDGVWCVPASPYRNLDGALWAIRFAREQQRPFLGTCGGFQHALLEYARNVLDWADAEHGEVAPDAPRAVVTPLTCTLVETVDRIHLAEGSLIADAYATTDIQEGYRCRYGVNPAFETQLLNGSLKATGHDGMGDLRAIELSDHPFFVATLFQPERAALAGILPPLVSALIKACARNRA